MPTISATNPSELAISSRHPSLPGHFPGNPIVPGVVILNSVFAKVRENFPDWQITGIRKLKFLQPLQGEQLFTIHYGTVKDNHLRFKCLLSADATALLEGNLTLHARDS